MKKRRLNECVGIYEKHHIIPISLGGRNDKENVIDLSPREHFIAHALLTKMVFQKEHKRAMAYAFARMKISNNKKGYNRIGNGKLYEKLKKSLKDEYSGLNNPFYGDHRFAGENNPFYGKKHSSETKDILRKQNLGKHSGEKNSFFGKTHTQHTKNILSLKRSSPVTIIFSNGQQVEFRSKKDIGKYLGICTSLGVQLCSIKRHLWSKYNIKEILNANS